MNNYTNNSSDNNSNNYNNYNNYNTTNNNYNNILYICHSYSSFQKDSIEAMSKYFENLSVLVRYNPLVEMLKYFPIPYLEPFKLHHKLDLTKKPPNLDLFLTPVLYAPLDSQYKKIGKSHHQAAEKVILKNNIKFDLIHSHFSWSAGYVGAKLKEKYSVPFIVTVHGYDIYELPFRDKEWIENIKYVLNSADYIITVSNSNYECIKKLNVKTPVKILPNGFRCAVFYPQNSDECRKTLGLPPGVKIILTVGALMDVKGHKYLIEAIGEVVKGRKDVLCIIVGGGNLKNKLQKQINSEGIQNHVKLVGPKNHNEIPIWMNSCDIFVLPSLKEGNPTVLFECLGCGIPFVGTKVGGIPEIIVSDDYGMISEPGDSKDLAKKIELALEKKWCSKDIRTYGERFVWENITKEIYDIYNNLLL
ncbi:MAG: glycosyltransferase [Methanosarcinaceae archaeon]|nr:glycosyltransferase [Methanosarcinaceae archaeon]